MSIVCNLERTNQLNLLPDQDLVDLCLHIESYQVTKNPTFLVLTLEFYLNFVTLMNSDAVIFNSPSKFLTVYDLSSLWVEPSG
ncbi:MAG: hypothetical protein EWV64_07065 [Microcystis flos-aquae Ma_QC_C_20070823_S18]|uniref:Uncharacterized protein n=2 Tax=Microcystis TaxID=1125 RepID=A0A552L2I7_9CHRO|nr:MAG: hypothetical protein EWV64_07065 [Microcystis flos-aquae Ma_QC_C_20070823_S18]TRU01837.1 MAG: hypothetical protein EWV65_03775 [Microcystis flos-aquae Ma_QC_C_20070823_S18D]TRV14432.1 MAG: hypothetical protein EWV45_05475 [Microcystis flos-aquae Mf_QC_C_20070823_S10D]TRV20924.1 MAG: hypothetical protein EWV72_18510 [Microcystis flos-aquae Mf_QC_C_20070823_S10]TRV30366.1 MAG: hypothetical protein EWV70_19370 [Microcystis flos-aquae Mf_QC_C_20070823_S20]TRV36270.1 MAG: hypothetical prote